ELLLSCKDLLTARSRSWAQTTEEGVSPLRGREDVGSKRDRPNHFARFRGGRAGTPVAPLGRYHSIPNSLAKAFHFESTSDFVFASMLISSGQGRAKPSVDHLRVASTPILEP